MRHVTLLNHDIRAMHGRQVGVAGNGQPTSTDVWRLVLTDKDTGDITEIIFGREVRDAVVQGLTSGIIVADPKEMR